MAARSRSSQAAFSRMVSIDCEIERSVPGNWLSAKKRSISSALASLAKFSVRCLTRRASRKPPCGTGMCVSQMCVGFESGLPHLVLSQQLGRVVLEVLPGHVTTLRVHCHRNDAKHRVLLAHLVLQIDIAGNISYIRSDRQPNQSPLTDIAKSTARRSSATSLIEPSAREIRSFSSCRSVPRYRRSISSNVPASPFFSTAL